MTSNPPSATGKLGNTEAIAYGLLQGPTELLPVSSSGHLVLAPWLVQSQYRDLDPELRKAFEVALHVGTAVALVLVMRDEVIEAIVELDGRRAVLVATTLAPAAAAALLFERQIERYASRPEVVAAGLVLGAGAMWWADRLPETRTRASATARDGLAIGFAQAMALVPGVSRNGATLVAARVLGFEREAAMELSMHAALPVIGGAAVLKGVRLAKRGMPAELRQPFVLGALGAFGTSVVCAKLMARSRRARRLTPYAVYRVGLAALVARELGRRRQR
ncbi:MAG: undecaprenyl-diphosphate phosphatase [Thermoleophilaceae bacterium]|nr:undecaprenyl-diphosphate phosphatase [Thermoleophilaceae bacterium]